MEDIKKMQPTAANVHIDRPLTDISIAYMQDQDEFIADKVFKPIKTDRQSNLYYVYSKEYFFRGGDELEVAEGTPTLGSGFGLTTQSYVCKVYGFHEKITDEARANCDEGINLEKTATTLVSQRLLIAKEKAWATTAFNASAWANSLEGASSATTGKFKYWDDITAQPIIDIRKAKLAIKKTTGYTPNVLVITEDVFEVLTQHPSVIDRYKYTTNQVVTKEMLAKLFDLERIEIAGAIALPNSVAEGQATASDYDWIMKNGALLLYVPASASIMQPAAGYNFYWTNLQGVGSSEKGVAIKSYRRESIRSDIVEGLCAFTYQIVCNDLGFFFKNCLSA